MNATGSLGIMLGWITVPTTLTILKEADHETSARTAGWQPSHGYHGLAGAQLRNGPRTGGSFGLAVISSQGRRPCARAPERSPPQGPLRATAHRPGGICRRQYALCAAPRNGSRPYG